jgi:adenylate kinase
MIIAITGTPGTGKTSISKILQKKGFEVVDLNKIACEKDFLIGTDKKRDSKIVDIDKINRFLEKNHKKNEIVIVEGHLSHLMKIVDKVIILRCHPKQLEKNLSKRRWKKKKINENVEAEILDVILCEAIDLHSEKNIFEIDVTDKPLDVAAYLVIKLIKDKFKYVEKYKIGQIDWSEEILKRY